MLTTSNSQTPAPLAIDTFCLTQGQSHRAARDGLFLIAIESCVGKGLLPEAALTTLKEHLTLLWCDSLYGDALCRKDNTQVAWHRDQEVGFFCTECGGH